MNLKVLQVPKSQDPMDPMSPGPWSKPSFLLIMFQSLWLFHFGFPAPLASFPLGLGPALNLRLEVSLPVRWWSYSPHCSPLPCGLYAGPTQHIEILSLDSNSCSTHPPKGKSSAYFQGFLPLAICQRELIGMKESAFYVFSSVKATSSQCLQVTRNSWSRLLPQYIALPVVNYLT